MDKMDPPPECNFHCPPPAFALTARAGSGGWALVAASPQARKFRVKQPPLTLGQSAALGGWWEYC